MPRVRGEEDIEEPMGERHSGLPMMYMAKKMLDLYHVGCTIPEYMSGPSQSTRIMHDAASRRRDFPGMTLDTFCWFVQSTSAQGGGLKAETKMSLLNPIFSHGVDKLDRQNRLSGLAKCSSNKALLTDYL